MIILPERLEKIRPYKPGKPSADPFVGQEVLQTSILCSNENNFGPSPIAMEAIRAALSQLHLYPDPSGELLKAALARYWKVDEKEILLGNGSDGILYTVFKAFFEGNDHLLTSEGSFVSLDSMAQIHDVPVRKVPLTDEYAFDLNGLYRAISGETKAIYICNPNNPSGAMISEHELRSFIDSIPKDILVIVDEAYFEFARALAFDYPDSKAMHYENVLTLRTFSKAYGLAGIRLGYALGHKFLIDSLHRVKLTFNPNSLAQCAGVAALQDTLHLQKTLRNNSIGLENLYNCLDHLGIRYITSYANFVMIDMKTEADAKYIQLKLKDRGILIRELGAFGLPHCLRISIGTPVQIESFMNEFAVLIEGMTRQRA